MKDLKQVIIEKIKQAGISPRPRWEFVLLHTTLWVAAALSVIIGGLAVSVIMRELSITEWDIVPRVIDGRLGAFLTILPYLWVGCLIVTLALASMLFTHTKRGYRHQPLLFAGIAVTASVAIGCMLHAAHFNLTVEGYLVRTVQPYETWVQDRDELYEAPERGILAGGVTSVESQTQFTVIGLKGSTWVVDASHAVLRDGVVVEPNVRLVMIGVVIGDHAFQAEEIRPLKRYYRRRTYINILSSADGEHERKIIWVL